MVATVITGLTIAEKILGAVKTLFGLKGELLQAQIEQKGRMGDLFEKMSICLEETAKSIRAGIYPGGRCTELETYATVLPTVITGKTLEVETKSIAAVLLESHRVEQLFALKGTPAGDAEIGKLDEAAGLLRALAALVRV